MKLNILILTTLYMSLSMASASEVCDCMSVCSLKGDPHLRSFWMKQASPTNAQVHSTDVTIFSSNSFQVRAKAGPGPASSKAKGNYLQHVQVGGRNIQASQCQSDTQKWVSHHNVGDDTSLSVTVRCAYPLHQHDALHLDVSLSLHNKHCEAIPDFKTWAQSKFGGLCTTQNGFGGSSTHGRKECREEQPTPKPTHKPHHPSSPATKSPTTPSTKAPSAPKRTKSPTTPATKAPSGPKRTKSPTTPATKAPSGPKRTKSPTPPAQDDNIITLAPSMNAGENMTCTIQGDPHANCFRDDQEWFQIYPQQHNKHVMLYEMPGRLEAIGRIGGFVSPTSNEWVHYVEQLLIKKDGEWQVEIDYETNCEPRLPGDDQTQLDATLKNSSLAPGHTEYIWDNEALVISWECVVDQDARPQGMKIVFNKQLNTSYAFEQKHNSGICAACNAAQPYTGKLPAATTQQKSLRGN